MTLARSEVTQRAGDITFAHAGGPCQEQAVVACDPVSRREFQLLACLSRGDVCNRCLRGKRAGRAWRLGAGVLSGDYRGRFFVLDNEAEELLVGEIGGCGMIDLIGKATGYAEES